MTHTVQFQKQLDAANARGVGQFHIFVGETYQWSTWRSLPVAAAVADREGGCLVVNDRGETVHRS